jgi:glutathione synthase/RimK-type ligase-like ATP-grasp enzyme
MKLLIPTEPDDLHAIFVKVGLETMGHEVQLLFTADHPTKQKNSVYFDDDFYRWASTDDYTTLDENDYDVVWWRRPRKPYLPKNISHPEDYKFIVRENILFNESLTSIIAPNAWWINEKEAANKANFKLLQLSLAQKCGMTIPTTLCSNNPKEIKDFLKKYEHCGAIYKPLCSNFWFESNIIKITYTNKITLEDLASNPLLQLVPGIYQPEIAKKYELRVTCFGDFIVAAKIDSQSHDDSRLDWRAIQGNNLDIQPYQLPITIENKLRDFMRKSGIVFGSFDFIVTKENDYIFLEVNEQGQFLWVEECNPEFKMLDIFINFILNKSRYYTWNLTDSVHYIEKYRDKIKKIFKQNMQRHIFLNNANTSNV